MSKLSKMIKKMKQDQERYQELVKLNRALCPHVSKKGKSWLKPFTEDDINKAECERCGEVLILDKDLLASDSLQMSANVIKTALAEVRAAAHLGKIELDDKTLELITKFDSEVLRDLPEAMAKMTRSDKKNKNKDKKKGKKKKKKELKRRRWS